MSFDNIVLKQRRPLVKVSKRSAFDSSESSQQDSYDDALLGLTTADTENTAHTKSDFLESGKHSLKPCLVERTDELNLFNARHKVKT